MKRTVDDKDMGAMAGMIKMSGSLLTAMALLALSGCKASDLTNAGGHYQGYLTEKTGAQTSQTVISGDITSPGYLRLDMKIATVEQTPRNWDLGLTASRTGKVSMTDTATHISTPLKSAADSCYINADAPSAADATTRVCYQGSQVTVDLTASGSTLSVIMNRADPANMPKLETPADYTLSQLTKRAVSQSFTSEIEFQNVVQAHLNSVSAHLNLVPHFTLGDVMSLATAAVNWTGLIRMVGDLAPFLVPSNWFLASEAHFNSDAERYGYQLMQANSGNISAGIAYGIVRDTQSLEKMQEERTLIAQVRQEVYDRERLGFLPQGSTDAVDSVLNACDKTILGLTDVVSQEYTSLAQASGFFNPKAVKSVTIDNSLSVENPDSFDPTQTSQLALTRSAELKQMDFLIAAAKTTKTERYFDWITPSGGAGAAIGAGMGAYIEIAAAQLAQTVVKRQQLQSQILQNVANTIQSLNDAVAGYQLAKQNIVIQNSLVNNYLNQMRLGIAVSTTDLITAFSGQMQANLDSLNAEFQYLVLHENVERLLYVGAYTGLGG